MNTTISNNTPLISVVICAFSMKRFDVMVEAINSILDQTYGNYEIIVVIDGNRDLRKRTDKEFENESKISIVENEKNEGPSISRNIGVSYAKGDIIAFIDDDAIAEHDWLYRINKNFLDYPEIEVYGGKLVPMYDEGSRKLPEELLWLVGCTYRGHPEKKQFVRNVISANMAVKRKVFNDIKFEKMFDGKNWKMEDTLFCIRIFMRKKDTILYDPETIVYHNVPKDRTTLKYIIERSYSEGKLKYDLSRIVQAGFADKKIFNQEQSYLNVLLRSIFVNSITLHLESAFLILMVMSSVMYGYTIRIWSYTK